MHLGSNFSTVRSGCSMSDMHFSSSISDVRLGSNSATCASATASVTCASAATQRRALRHQPSDVRTLRHQPSDVCVSFEGNYSDARVLRQQLRLCALRQPFNNMRHCAFLLLFSGMQNAPPHQHFSSNSATRTPAATRWHAPHLHLFSSQFSTTKVIVSKHKENSAQSQS